MNEVALITVTYKGKELTKLAFIDKNTGEAFVETIMSFLTEEAKKNFSFTGETLTVYTPKSILGECAGFAAGEIKPANTILNMIIVFNKMLNIILLN